MPEDVECVSGLGFPRAALAMHIICRAFGASSLSLSLSICLGVHALALFIVAVALGDVWCFSRRLVCFVGIASDEMRQASSSVYVWVCTVTLAELCDCERLEIVTGTEIARFLSGAWRSRIASASHSEGCV